MTTEETTKSQTTESHYTGGALNEERSCKPTEENVLIGFPKLLVGLFFFVILGSMCSLFMSVAFFYNMVKPPITKFTYQIPATYQEIPATATMATTTMMTNATSTKEAALYEAFVSLDRSYVTVSQQLAAIIMQQCTGKVAEQAPQPQATSTQQ